MTQPVNSPNMTTVHVAARRRRHTSLVASQRMAATVPDAGARGKPGRGPGLSVLSEGWREPARLRSTPATRPFDMLRAMPAPGNHGSRSSLVVIDGPAGAGKTTVAHRVAAHFGFTILDTGAIYRALALFAEREGVGWEDEDGLAGLVDALPLRFEADPDGQTQRVWLGNDDVTTQIRTPHISDGASRVSVHPKVRSGLLGLQRRLAREAEPGCVAEGRDMGTVVFPDAAHKFFLTANESTRVERRHHELVDRNGASAPTRDEVAAEMAKRDERDSQRAVAPLTRADDATLVDSSARDIDEVVALIVASVEPRSP